MKYCSKCGKEIHDEAVICVHCGCAVEGAYLSPNHRTSIDPYDAESPGFLVLSLLIPIFGIIYFAIYNKIRPKKSKSCLIGAGIGFGLGILYYIIFLALMLA